MIVYLPWSVDWYERLLFIRIGWGYVVARWKTHGITIIW